MINNGILTPEVNIDLISKLIPDAELTPRSIEDVIELPSFYSKILELEKKTKTNFGELDYAMQDALVLRRLQQMTNTLMLNPMWKERMAEGGLISAPRNFEDWQKIPISDKNIMQEYFMGERPGMVVPLQYNGFEIVASGGTSSGLPSETVYSLRELQDTYKIAGRFMGQYQLPNYLPDDAPKWVITSLADYQMWSSGTMVGGVLQAIPGVNYIGAGPVRQEVYQQIMSYPGSKVFMGITQGIALLVDFGLGLSDEERNSFRVAMYGSGVLPQRKRDELKEMYPNIEILSYFAATQAETIGLQLDANRPELSAVPGLHLIEIVDENGKWVEEGEEGELVVTRLHAHEVPVPRFKIGDRMIRKPRKYGPGLKADQFEFSGRSGDIIHLGDSQFPARVVYETLAKDLSRAGVFDLESYAHEIQFVNDRPGKKLSFLATVDDAMGAAGRMEHTLGAAGSRKIFIDSMIRALSIFNLGEANTYYLDKSGYEFEIRFVYRHSEEIHRTAVGKVPLLRDIV